MVDSAHIRGHSHTFRDLKTLLAKALPRAPATSWPGSRRQCEEERVCAQMALADVPLTRVSRRTAHPLRTDEVTRLIFDYARRSGVRAGTRVSRWASSATGCSSDASDTAKR